MAKTKIKERKEMQKQDCKKRSRAFTLLLLIFLLSIAFMMQVFAQQVKIETTPIGSVEKIFGKGILININGERQILSWGELVDANLILDQNKIEIASTPDKITGLITKDGWYIPLGKKENTITISSSTPVQKIEFKGKDTQVKAAWENLNKQLKGKISLPKDTTIKYAEIKDVNGNTYQVLLSNEDGKLIVDSGSSFVGVNIKAYKEGELVGGKAFSPLKNIAPDDLTKIVAENMGIPEDVASALVAEHVDFTTGLINKEESFIVFTKPSPTALLGYKVLGGVEQLARLFPFGRWSSTIFSLTKYLALGVGWGGAAMKTFKWDLGEGPALTIMRGVWIYLSDIAASKFAIDLANDAGEAKAEVPLKGTKWCELCNWDNYTVCTEERCRMLGQCVYKSVLPDPRGGICLPAACTEGYPKISSMNVSFHIDETHVDKTAQSSNCPGGKGECALEEKGGEPIEISYNVSYAVISIATQQYAECRYIVDKKGANFSEMSTIEGDLYMPKTRTFRLDVARLEPGRTHVVYIKCASTCNEHPPGFDYNYIKFKIGEKPDFLPPNIVMVDPDDKMQYVSDRLGTITIKLWLDENGNCRYSTKREGLSKEWKEESTLQCLEANESANGTMCTWTRAEEWEIKNDSTKTKIGKFVISANCIPNEKCRYKDAMGQVHYYNRSICTMCNITINASDVFADVYNWSQMGEDIGRFAESCKENPSTTGCAEFTQYVLNKGIDISRIKDMGVNKLFSLNFRCADDKGNVMPIDETYEYRLFTFPEYNISIESPAPGFSTYEKYVDMRVVSDRPTDCRFSYNKTVVPLPTGVTGKGYVESDFNKMQKIDDVFATEHKGRIENLARGSYVLLVKCRDAGGMEKAANTTFTIGQAPMPKVIRISVEGNDLKIETDVKAKCIYSIDEAKGCNFVEGTVVKTTAGVTVQKQAQDMASMNTFNHISTYVPEWTYYIKCKDVWGDNAYPSNCTAIIKPFELVQSVSSA